MCVREYVVGDKVNGFVVKSSERIKLKRGYDIIYMCECTTCKTVSKKKKYTIEKYGCEKCYKTRFSYSYNIGQIVNGVVITNRRFTRDNSVKKFYSYMCSKCGETHIDISEQTITKSKTLCANCFEESKYLYNVGDIVNGLRITNRYYIAINSKTNHRTRKYDYICQKCGYESLKVEYELTKGRGCPCCANNVTVEHVNSIVANEETHWMVDYFQGGWNEAKLYAPQSNQYVTMKCPLCNTVKNRQTMISFLFREKTIGCACSDGISYPEKFFLCFLKQCNIDYEYQYTKKNEEWVGSYKYDFYLPKYNSIIEIHGEPHYERGYYGGNGERSKTVEEIQEVDALKKQLAIKNNIDNYIEIDCRKSSKKWIENSIINSNITNIIGVSKSSIDFLKCAEYAESNIVYNVCSDFSNGTTTNYLCEKYDLTKTTILRYLKRGTEIGWCVYNGVDGLRIGSKFCQEKNKKEVVIIKQNSIVNYCDSLKTTKKTMLDTYNILIITDTISKYCRNGKNRDGFSFKFVSDLSPQELQELEEFKIKNNITPIS